MQSTGVYFSGLRLRFRSILRARAVWWIAAALLVIQSVMTMGGSFFVDAVDWAYLNLGLSREGIFSGKLWQILTHGLLHAGFLHTAANVFCLILIGARVEHLLGKQGIWKCVGAGIIGGGLVHLMLSPDGLLVGASGGCMALLILLTTLSPESRMWPVPVSGRNLGIGLMLAELLMALSDPRHGVPVFSRFGKVLESQGLGDWFIIGHACHFGGGLAGFLFGLWLLRPRVTAESLRRDRERREARNARSL